MQPYFDAHVVAPENPVTESFDLPRDFGGALLSGPQARKVREAYSRYRPEPMWRHVETMDRIAGETHASFPSRTCEVIELDMTPKALFNWLKKPSEWWPLCDSLRNTGRLVRLPLPPGTRVLAAAKSLIRKFPKTLFLIDPFTSGPDSGWEGHVKLADAENCYLTTLGLRPVELYPDEEGALERPGLPETAFLDVVVHNPPTPPAFKPPTRLLAPGREDGLPTSGFMPAIAPIEPETEFPALPPAPKARRRAPWTKEKAEEALYFVTGEVGAGKLLYASGLEWEALAVGVDRVLRSWIEEYPKLESAECELIMCGNARLLFKSKGDLIGEMS